METAGSSSFPSSENGCPQVQAKLTHDGKAYEFWVAPVDLTTLRASMGWQRRLRRALVDEIKADFYPLAVLIYVAHLPDGRIFCVGGQHCSTAALELGFKEWPIAVHTHVSDEQKAAELYRFLLNVHRASPTTQTEVDLVAEVSEALLHQQVLHRAGRTFARTRSQANWNAFTTFGTTMWVEKRVSADELVKQLEFANRAWPDQPEVCNGDVVRAVFYLFRDWRTVHGKFKQEELANTLRGTDLESFIDVARIAPFRRTFGKESMGQALARVLAEHFNKKTPGYKLYHISALSAGESPRETQE